MENLLDVVRTRVLARGAGLQSVAVEDGTIVLRAAQPIPHRDRLAGAFGDIVRVGSAQVRVERRDGWRDVLTQVLQRLQPEWAAPPAVARTRADYGSFADAPRRPAVNGRPRQPDARRGRR